MPAVYFAATHGKILSGATTSGEVDLRGLRLTGIEFPAALTGATVTFTAAERSASDNGNPQAVFQTVAVSTGSGAVTDVSVPSSTAKTVFFSSAVQISNCVLKVVSASSEGADRDLILYVAPTG